MRPTPLRHRARLLLAAVLSVALAAGAAALVAAPAQAKTWLAPSADPEVDPSKNLNEFENRILIQINKARVDKGLKKVRVFQSCVDAGPSAGRARSSAPASSCTVTR